jgi:uncharacterized protein (DUF433 family)
VTTPIHSAGLPVAVGRFRVPQVERSGGILDLQDNTMPTKPAVVHSDPDILGGTAVFVGTRVPVKSLYDYLEAGDSLDEFLDSFPSVTREQAIAALELARSMTEAHATVAR